MPEISGFNSLLIDNILYVFIYLTFASSVTLSVFVHMSNMLENISRSVLLTVGQSDSGLEDIRNRDWFSVQNLAGWLVRMHKPEKIEQPSLLSFCRIPYNSI